MFGLEFVEVFLGGLVMWEIILLIVLVGGIVGSTYYESPWMLAVFMAFLIFFNWSTVGSIWASVTLSGFLWFVAGYILIGVVWSTFKWYKKAVRIRDGYKNRGHKYTAEEVKEEINNSKDYEEFIFWIMSWPLSSLGYFLGDFIIDVLKKLIDKLGTIYNKITDKVMKDF